MACNKGVTLTCRCRVDLPLERSIRGLHSAGLLLRRLRLPCLRRDGQRGASRSDTQHTDTCELAGQGSSASPQRLHPPEAAIQVITHLLCSTVADTSVSRQHPFEVIPMQLLPMEAVGQATRAMNARRRSSGWRGCWWTLDWPPWSRKTAGAICRHVLQSMQDEST